MRFITPPAADTVKIMEEFKAYLDKVKLNGDFTFRYSPKTEMLTEKIKLSFTPLAYLKMRTLVNMCEDEIAWHGVVHASEDRKTFTITDILVYPQTVSGATVATDEVKYEAWHQALDDDAYNNLRFQGHSHVKMGASPSGVDTTLYDNMLQTLSDDSYYIFMITNKRDENWINIYDLASNVIYETADIIVTLEGLDTNWYTKTKTEFITTRAWTTYGAGGTYASNTAVRSSPLTDVTKTRSFNSDLKKTEKEPKLSKEEKKELKKLKEQEKDPFFAQDGWSKNRIVDESEAYYTDMYLHRHKM